MALPQEDCKAGKQTCCRCPKAQSQKLHDPPRFKRRRIKTPICDGKVLWSHCKRACGVGYRCGIFGNTIHREGNECKCPHQAGAQQMIPSFSAHGSYAFTIVHCLNMSFKLHPQCLAKSLAQNRSPVSVSLKSQRWP